MTTKCWRIYHDSINEPALILLSNREFRKKFRACLAGEVNEFTPFVRPDRGRPFGSEWASLRSQVFSRDNYACRYCGARGVRLECDHVVPVSRGGGDDLSNLATACRDCNRSKRAKLLEDWMPGIDIGEIDIHWTARAQSR